MTSWKAELPTKILAAMRCVYAVLHDQAIDRYEWEGEDGNGGVQDYIVSLVRREVKKAYYQGYIAGGKDVFCEMEPNCDGALYSEDIARIGAERKFLEWEKNEYA